MFKDDIAAKEGNNQEINNLEILKCLFLSVVCDQERVHARQTTRIQVKCKDSPKRVNENQSIIWSCEIKSKRNNLTHDII